MQIGRKVYFDNSSGSILVITSEMSGDVAETTVEQDFAVYQALHERVPSTVGMIQLDYGTYAYEFGSKILDSVDVAALTLRFKDRPDSEPQPIPVTETLGQKVQRLETENTDLKSRLSDVELYIADSMGGGA